MNRTRTNRTAKRFPSRRRLRAVEVGADQLVGLLEWVLRGRPRALRNLRTRHRDYCFRLYAELERAERQSGIRTRRRRAA
jgi:hypothetical protein